MPPTLDDIRQFMDVTDDELNAEEQNLFGGGVDKEITPNVVEIVSILQAEPILSEPCLKFLRQKMGEMAAAKLLALYTPEEIEALKQRFGIKPGSG